MPRKLSCAWGRGDAYDARTLPPYRCERRFPRPQIGVGTPRSPLPADHSTIGVGSGRPSQSSRSSSGTSTHGPDASNYDIYVLGPKLRLNKHKRQRGHKVKVRRSVIQRSVSSGSSEQLEMTLCGHSSIQVEVRRRSGAGPFSVSVTRP